MKTISKYVFWLFLSGFLLFTAGNIIAQDNKALYLRRYQNGINLYQSSRWYEAAAEFRYAQEIASDIDDWSEALYWVILSELAYSDYGSAIIDMDELERRAPASPYTRDMVYHRARIFYNLGYFEDSLLLFRRYIDSVSERDIDTDTEDRIAAAYYWMGECLYSMGQFDEAESFFVWVINRYPDSPKNEVSSYRVDLIRQRKIEAELLALLQWSHEESLRNNEEYQRTLRAYEYSLNDYQRRIMELSQGSSMTFQELQDPPPVVVNPDTPRSNIQLEEYTPPGSQSANERNLEWARQLSYEVERLIREYEFGGSR